jgi:hypothetical protein
MLREKCARTQNKSSVAQNPPSSHQPVIRHQHKHDEDYGDKPRIDGSPSHDEPRTSPAYPLHPQRGTPRGPYPFEQTSMRAKLFGEFDFFLDRSRLNRRVLWTMFEQETCPASSGEDPIVLFLNYGILWHARSRNTGCHFHRFFIQFHGF